MFNRKLQAQQTCFHQATEIPTKRGLGLITVGILGQKCVNQLDRKAGLSLALGEGGLGERGALLPKAIIQIGEEGLCRLQLLFSLAQLAGA